MKKILLTVNVLILFCCTSSDDSISQTIELDLLYGQWYDSSLCNAQNSLLLNSNDGYIRTSSGNTCDMNVNDTYRYSGNFIVNANNIVFNQLTEELIEEGNVNSVPVEEDATLLHAKIIELTLETLVIEFKIRNNISGQETFSFWNLEK